MRPAFQKSIEKDLTLISSPRKRSGTETPPTSKKIGIISCVKIVPKRKMIMNKKTRKLKKCLTCQTVKYEYLENCDECKKGFCIECLGLYHGSERLFCQNCFDKKSDEEKVVMLGKENEKYSDKQLETKRKKYRE
jgi:hypothetical protein